VRGRAIERAAFAAAHGNKRSGTTPAASPRHAKKSTWPSASAPHDDALGDEIDGSREEHVEQVEESVDKREEEVSQAKFLLCGRMVRTTVRGKSVTQAPLVQVPTDQHGNAFISPQEAKYKAAKEHRKQLERAVKLEEFQEKRIMERIQVLELAKDAEVDRQRELEGRRKRRMARSEQLKKELEEGWSVKLQEEAEELKKKKEDEEEKQKEIERLKRYHKAQKAKLEKWHEERSHDESLDPAERARAKRQEQRGKAEQARAAPPEILPMKRLEVQKRIDCKVFFFVRRAFKLD